MHTTFQNKHKQQSQNSASTVLTSASDKINLDYLETHGRRLTYSGLRTKTYVCMYTVVLFSLKHAKKNQKKFNCILWRDYLFIAQLVSAQLQQSYLILFVFLHS